MAERVLHDLTGRAPAQQNGQNLRSKLQQQLEIDLTRLLHNPNYLDLELIVDSGSLFSHSCIVKARAAKFYTFITTECFASRTSLVTTVHIENASINYIRKFLENIYSSAFHSESETCVLKYLVNTREERKRLNEKLVSPETERFFTPKSSPSELYKPFTLLTTSKDEITLARTQNNTNVQSYYRIVSVEDITSEKVDTALDKELAEQDALFESLKCISTKKKSINKPSSLPLAKKQPWKEIRESTRRLPTWKPKLNDGDLHGYRCRVQKSQILMMSNSPDIDINSSKSDSGMDLPVVPMDTSMDGPVTDTSDGASHDSATKIHQDLLVDALLQNDSASYFDKTKEVIYDDRQIIAPAISAAESGMALFVESVPPLHTEPLSLIALSTPPSSPSAHTYVPNSANSIQHSSNSFFIDASSLLDEEEIMSPPLRISEPQIIADAHEENVSVFSDVATDSDLERRQGELIFKASIPHFSKHEIDEPRRMIGSHEDFGLEQVVPVSTSVLDRSNDSALYSRSLPYDGIQSFDIRSSVTPVHVGEDVLPSQPVSLKQLYNKATERNALTENIPDRKTPPIDIFQNKNSMENTAIVSGGVSPKDYSSVSSNSPRLPRRHELAPIISGGMDLPTPEDSCTKRKSHSSGEVWVVDVGNSKQADKMPTMADAEEVSPKPNFAIEKSKFSSPASTKELENLEMNIFPVEKSSSLGYFIDFGSCESTPSVPKERKHRNECKNIKKNIFSIFIDMNNDSKDNTSEKGSIGDEHIEAQDSDGTECGSAASKASSKKGHYMFIEAEPSSLKKAASTVKQSTHFSRISGAQSLDKDNDEYSLESVESKRSNCSSGQASEERDVWNWDNTSHLLDSHSTDNGSITKTNQVLFKKDSTFIIDGIENKYSPHSGGKPTDGLHTVIEGTTLKSPIKIEEGDSGVVATEESDDSFVRLSDMDNTANNPYMGSKRSLEVQNSAVAQSVKKKPMGIMSQSIPETGWQKNRHSRIPEREKVMSRSTGGTVASCRVSKSLTRLFPHLSASTLSLARTHTSDYSEPPSMLSSIDGNGLDISTSETDLSCHGDGAARLGQDLLRMFLDEISPDVVVEVAGRRIKAHKCILSSRCQYFAAMLSGGWVESAGNVISLQGFSYAAVHFAMCHIYCGESEVPDSLNIVELATLADMLCLEGLKEVISYTLRVKYCHSFHSPCGACTVGVMDCLPVASDYGLDDLFRKCLRWIAKFYVKVWPTKTFANLRKEHIEKCLQYQVVHMTVENVLDTLLGIDKIRGTLPSIRWAEIVTKSINKLQDSAVKFVAEHFSSILTSDQFLALGRDGEWSIDRLEKSLIQATKKLPPEQACWSHARLHSMIALASSSNPPEEIQWNQTFIVMLGTLSEYVQSSLIKQAPRAARSKAWQQMEPELRTVIQEAACLVIPAASAHMPRRSFPKAASGTSLPSSLRSSTRTSDLRQMKLTMSQHVKQPSTVLPSNTKTNATADTRGKNEVIRRYDVRKSQSTSAVKESMNKPISAPPRRFAEVKSRYMQPHSPRKSVAPMVAPKKNGISSSDSSRNCSPAMARATSAKAGKIIRKAPAATAPARSIASTTNARPLAQLAPDDNMSTDSLATLSSCGEKEILAKRQSSGKENVLEDKKGFISMPRKTQSLSSFPSAGVSKPRTMIPRKEVNNQRPWRVAATKPGECATDAPTRVSSAVAQKAVRSRLSTNKNNGNTHISLVDSENNKTKTPFKPPAFVSRSGTFLKDEPTVLKRPDIV